ncbi:hypothetical protein AB0P21_13390 [Kribbella sp. NPDC056861]|uniref:hypothetical protein n=1 Tax=Kribbella sp. NPDC056861 TaxID=3154857 RepID=UPI003429E0EF
MTRLPFRKRFWDLGWGGRGMDAMFVLAIGGAILGGVAGWIGGEWLMGAGIGILVGLVAFVALVIWAHRGQQPQECKH